MIIKSSEFVISSQFHQQCPQPDLPEYAFVGRSNVGKSSLINMLVGKKGLAKTSSTPGKTQLINHFLINKEWFLVDLPGYGFAKASLERRAVWQKMLYNYLKERLNLLNTFLLIDSRIPPQQSDMDFMEWLGENQIPFTIVFTKTDKLSATKLNANIDTYKEKLNESWDQLPLIIISSSETQKGKEDVLNFIEDTNKIFVPLKK